MLGGTVADEDDIFVLAAELLTLGVAVPSVTEMLSDVETLVWPDYRVKRFFVADLFFVAWFYVPSWSCRDPSY